MVKLFMAINLETAEKKINEFLKANPHIEITSISHSDLGKATRIGIAQWMILVVLKEKTKGG